MADPTRGQDYFLYINTATVASPSWQLIGGQRDATLNRGTEEIDVTDKNNSGWKENLAGLRSWSIDLDMLVELGDTGLTKLEDVFHTNQAQAHIKLEDADLNTYIGLCTITDFSWGLPLADAATASVSLSGSGELARA
jgi:TP901-1 family phage major tail protein